MLFEEQQLEATQLLHLKGIVHGLAVARVSLEIQDQEVLEAEPYCTVFIYILYEIRLTKS